MPRATWSGSISFGLVNVPVQLFTATQQQDIRFNQFQEGTGQRIHYKRVAEESGDEVDFGDIVKGYEIEKGRYVIVEPAELEAIEPGQTKTIDIEDFVDIGDVDPIYFEKTYYVGPADNAGAKKAYALMLAALKDAGRAGVAKFVMRTKQYLALLRVKDDALVLETMLFADEVRSTTDIDTLPVDVEVTEREKAMALSLIESMTVPWDPAQYKDTYREKVMDLIERKAKGETIVVDQPEEQPGDVVDLMAALQASLDKAKQTKKPTAGESSPPAAAMDLDKLSREELYNKAKDAEIPGRSDMNKHELIEALSNAS